MLLGVKLPGAAKDAAARLAVFEAELGRPVDLVLEFSERTKWDGFISAQYFAGFHKAHGRTVVHSVPLCVDDKATNTGWLAEVAAGRRDAAFTRAAREYHAAGAHEIRLGWELNGTWYKWGVAHPQRPLAPAPTHTDFVAAWRRVVNIFRTVSQEFVFAWNLSVNAGTQADVLARYPGRGYVDRLTVDFYYNRKWWPKAAADTWAQACRAEVGFDWLYELAQGWGLGFGIDEFGVDNDAEGAAMLEQVQEWCATREVRHLIYWHNNGSLPDPGELGAVTWPVFKRWFNPPPAPVPEVDPRDAEIARLSELLALETTRSRQLARELQDTEAALDRSESGRGEAERQFQMKVQQLGSAYDELAQAKELIATQSATIATLTDRVTKLDGQMQALRAALRPVVAEGLPNAD